MRKLSKKKISSTDCDLVDSSGNPFARSELSNTSYPVDMSIVLKCKTVAEITIHDLISSMVYFDKAEQSITKEQFVSSGEIDEVTGEQIDPVIDIVDVTADLLNEAISSVIKYGSAFAKDFNVIEKDGQLWLVRSETKGPEQLNLHLPHSPSY